jgi:Flp pilus assembly protein TadD
MTQRQEGNEQGAENNLRSGGLWRFSLQLSLALIGLFCCYRLSFDSARHGYSRLLSMFSIIQLSVEPADSATRLTPRDPEAHYTRALALVNLQRLDDAVTELRTSTQLRPHYYYEWLDLGVTLDRLGDETGSVAALQQSIRLAPRFSQPRWQLGNLLYRQGRYSDAFAEFRIAATTNPNLVQQMLDLAWAASQGDPGGFEALIQPQSRVSHLEIARFLAWHGKGAAAAAHARAMGRPEEGRERELLHQTVTELIARDLYVDAYQTWLMDQTPSERGTNPAGVVLNGSFAEPVIKEDSGFSWQLTLPPNVAASIQPSGPSEGTRSLLLEFAGDSPSGLSLLHQLLLIKPNSHYSLSFMVKAENLVTGGPAIVRVDEANHGSPTTLAVSDVLATGATEWRRSQLRFSTTDNSSAVIIGVQRLACSQPPCPAFGRLFFSQFTLTQE